MNMNDYNSITPIKFMIVMNKMYVTVANNTDK